MSENKEVALIILGAIALVVFLFAIGPFLTMVTWNFVMPYLFGLPKIGFWMAMALNWLAATFFKTISWNKK